MKKQTTLWWLSSNFFVRVDSWFTWTGAVGGEAEGVGTWLGVARRVAERLLQPVWQVDPTPAGGLDYGQHAKNEKANRAAFRTDAALAPDHSRSQGAPSLVVVGLYTISLSIWFHLPPCTFHTPHNFHGIPPRQSL